MIDSFSGEHRFLSNFWPCTVRLDGVLYTSVEHAYQAAKTIDPKERAAIRAEVSAAKAKMLGKKVTVRIGWGKYEAAGDA